MCTIGTLIFTETGLPPLDDDRGPSFIPISAEGIMRMNFFSKGNADVQSCINTLATSVLGGGMKIMRDGVSLKQDLKEKINDRWVIFLRDLVYQLSVFGFCFVRNEDQVPSTYDITTLDIRYRQSYNGQYEFFVKRQWSTSGMSNMLLGGGSSKRQRVEGGWDQLPRDTVVLLLYPPDSLGRIRVPLTSVSSLVAYSFSIMGADVRAKNREAMPVLITETGERGTGEAEDIERDFNLAGDRIHLTGHIINKEEEREQLRERLITDAAARAYERERESKVAEFVPFVDVDPGMDATYFPHEPSHSAAYLPRIDLPDGRRVARGPESRSTGNPVEIMEELGKKIGSVLGVPYFLFGSGRSGVAHNQMVIGTFYQTQRWWRTVLASATKTMFFVIFRSQLSRDAIELAKARKEPNLEKVLTGPNNPYLAEIAKLDVVFPSMFDVHLIEGLFMTGLMSPKNAVHHLAAYFQIPEEAIHEKPALLLQLQMATGKPGGGGAGGGLGESAKTHTGSISSDGSQSSRDA